LRPRRGPGARRPALRPRAAGARGGGPDARRGAEGPRAPGPRDRGGGPRLLGAPPRERRRAALVRGLAALRLPLRRGPGAGPRPRVRAVEHRSRQRRELRRALVHGRVGRGRRAMKENVARRLVWAAIAGLLAAGPLAAADQPAPPGAVATVGDT